MKTFKEFTDEDIMENTSFKRVSSGVAASKMYGLENKVLSSDDIATKINLLAKMLTVQSTLLFSQDLFSKKR